MILKALTTTKVEIDTQINFKSLVYHITWCRRMYGTTISWTYHKIYSLLLSCFWGAWRRNFLELTYIFYIATIPKVNTDHMPAMNQKSMPRSFKSLYIYHITWCRTEGYGSTIYWTYHKINGPTLSCFWGLRRTCRHAWNILPPQMSTPHDHALYTNRKSKIQNRITWCTATMHVPEIDHQSYIIITLDLSQLRWASVEEELPV